MAEEAATTHPRPFVFVLMPFDSKFDDIYRYGIQGAATDAGAYAERVDGQIFAEGMLERIFNQISKADVVVADMTGRNPNVFYEVGYAHALAKIVLLLTQSSDDIPFDLKHYQHTVYGGQITVLQHELTRRLRWALGEARRRRISTPSESFSVEIAGVTIPVVSGEHPPPTISGAVATADLAFGLPVVLRNDADETLPSISHVYLFTEEDAPLVPSALEATDLYNYPYGTHPFLPDRSESRLASSTSTGLGAPDGLTRQYRLALRLPPIPPGAVETTHLILMFTNNRKVTQSAYRLRLHTLARYYDYSFRLQVRVLEASQR